VKSLFCKAKKAGFAPVKAILGRVGKLLKGFKVATFFFAFEE
jgi:hypothetical protein